LKTHIKELRKERNVTQQEIADELGVTKSYIHYVELGRTNITLENALKIANFLNVSLNELVGRQDGQAETHKNY